MPDIVGGPQFISTHQTYFGTKNGVDLRFKSGRTLQARKFGRTNVLHGYRMARNNDKLFRATIASGVKSSNFGMDVATSTFRSVMFTRDFCTLRRSSKMSISLTCCMNAKGAP